MYVQLIESHEVLVGTSLFTSCVQILLARSASSSCHTVVQAIRWKSRLAYSGCAAIEKWRGNLLRFCKGRADRQVCSVALPKHHEDMTNKDSCELGSVRCSAEPCDVGAAETMAASHIR